MYLTSAERVLAGNLAVPPFLRVLCALDGSEPSAEAVRQAITLSHPDADLTLLTVTDFQDLDDGQAEQAVQTASRAAHDAGVDARVKISHDADTQAAILAEACRHDLLVLGARGQRHGAALRLGSTAISALHRSPVPVLVARAPAPTGFPFPRDILLATDGSSAMAPTVATTAAIARRHHARVALVHVGHSTRAVRRELAEQATTLYEAAGVEPVVMQVDGGAPQRLAGIARDLRPSLLVAGSHLLTGYASFASVSERIGAIAPCSVLVTRHAA